LDAHGRATGALPAFAADPDTMLTMYRAMVLVRAFDAKAVNLQRTGRLGTYPSCLGHEATHVGVGAALRAEDVMFPVYREVGTQFWRGVRPVDVLRYWGGDERGTLFSATPEDFPFCIPIGSQMPQAAGAAMAFKVRRERRCALAFVGDGGTSQGAFYEALNYAGVAKLPLVTVIVNNGWAISMPVSLQTAAPTLAHKAVGAGMPGVRVDGNDVIGVRQVLESALARARDGGGPSLIEAVTYRLADHTTSDDAGRYRSSTEVEAARSAEPMLRTRQYLVANAWWDQAREAQLLLECAAIIEAAVTDYLATPLQHTDAMFDYLYERPHAALLRQRLAARRPPGSG